VTGSASVRFQKVWDSSKYLNTAFRENDVSRTSQPTCNLSYISWYNGNVICAYSASVADHRHKPLESDASSTICLHFNLSWAEWLSSWRLALHQSTISSTHSLCGHYTLFFPSTPYQNQPLDLSTVIHSPLYAQIVAISSVSLLGVYIISFWFIFTMADFNVVNDWYFVFLFPPVVDNIRAMMIVWKIRVKIIRTVLCCNCQSYSICYRGTLFWLAVSRTLCAECIYNVVQQHNLSDVANSIPHLCTEIHSHNSERIIKIDPSLTKLC